MKKTIVPEFLDYFRVVGGGNKDEDVSVMEKKGSIEMEKKSKKSEDEWQKGIEDASDDEYDDDEDENKSQRGVRKNVAGNRGRKARKLNLDVKELSRKSEYDDDDDGNKS
ncbi:hypothetical protein CFP56_020576 [Quercus suber]|uniref:Uncharacterized protein n=1 Tax=Quercus suber TaxID=58331 RepID=A0AAW0KEU3_QUESU